MLLVRDMFDLQRDAGGHCTEGDGHRPEGGLGFGGIALLLGSDGWRGLVWDATSGVADSGAAVLKTAEPETVPQVRILSPPPVFCWKIGHFVIAGDAMCPRGAPQGEMMEQVGMFACPGRPEGVQ